MSDKNNHQRAKIVRLALIIIAIMPVLLGILQIVHFSCWLFDFNYESTIIFQITEFSSMLLLFSLIISLYARFCIFHRITIISTLYVNSSYIFMDLYPSLYLYNISNLCAILVIIAGIIGCFYHFSLQIKDFIRYVRIQSAQ